jgi:phosphoribosylglycinamide formyltransferase-1
MMSPSKAAYSMTEAKQKLGVLCSGRGTDLQSIMDAIDRGEVAAEIAVVLTDKPDAFALERAAKAGIKAVCVNRKQFDGRESFEQALVGQLQAAGVTLVVLAGFMRILTPYFVRQYAGRIMNIPSGPAAELPGGTCPSGRAGLWRQSQRLHRAFRR